MKRQGGSNKLFCNSSFLKWQKMIWFILTMPQLVWMGGWGFRKGKEPFWTKGHQVAQQVWLNYKLDNWELKVQVLEEASSSLLQQVQTNSGTHPAPYSTIIGSFSVQDKWLKHKTDYSIEYQGEKYMELYCHSPIYLHGMHMNNFTFNFKNVVPTPTLTVTNKMLALT